MVNQEERSDRPLLCSLMGYGMLIIGGVMGVFCLWSAIIHLGAIPYDLSGRVVAFHVVSGVIAIVLAPLPVIAGSGILAGKRWAPACAIATWYLYSAAAIAGYLQIACSFNRTLYDPSLVRSIFEDAIILKAVIFSLGLLLLNAVVTVAMLALKQEPVNTS